MAATALQLGRLSVGAVGGGPTRNISNLYVHRIPMWYLKCYIPRNPINKKKKVNHQRITNGYNDLGRITNGYIDLGSAKAPRIRSHN